MSRGTFTTTLIWENGDDEIRASVRVIYSYSPGYAPTMEEPGSVGELEIISIKPADPTISVPERFETDEGLLNECVSDYLDEQELAREWREQSRRDSLMGGF